MRPIDVLTSPWAIIPAKLSEITEIYSRHVRGEKIDLDALETRLGAPLANEPKPYQVQDGVALLALDGVVAKKMNLFTRVSGGTSTQIFARDFRAALADPSVDAIAMIVDSPGGSVDGTQELARIVMEARGQEKPIVAWVDGMMASAAYWIGSAADAVYLGASTDAIGSIGVAMQHVDYSAYEQKQGIKTTDIYAGQYKRIASENAPLSKEGKAYLQSQVDAIYTVFVDAVAQQRGVSTEQVLKDMADGRIFIGTQAIDNGLVDGAATLDVLVADLAAGRYTRKRSFGAGAAPTAGKDANGAGAVPIISSTSKGKSIMNREELAKAHSELLTALLAEGHAAGVLVGRTEGAAAELARIQAVEGQSLPGHEALIKTLKFDGKTTGSEAAVQVLAAERTIGEARLQAHMMDAPRPAPHAITPAPKPADPNAGKSPEDLAKAKWDGDEALRASFGGIYEAYLAAEKADAAGRVKTLGKKAA